MLLGTSALTPAYDPVDAVDEIPCHVNLAVPIYVAYALSDGLTGPNTRSGDAIDAKLSDVFKFDAKTCPMALFHGGTDPYSPLGSTEIYRQLRKNENTEPRSTSLPTVDTALWGTRIKEKQVPPTIIGSIGSANSCDR